MTKFIEFESANDLEINDFCVNFPFDRKKNEIKLWIVIIKQDLWNVVVILSASISLVRIESNVWCAGAKLRQNFYRLMFDLVWSQSIAYKMFP